MMRPVASTVICPPAASSLAPASSVTSRATITMVPGPASRRPFEVATTSAPGRKSRTDPGSTVRDVVIRHGSGTGLPHSSSTVVARTPVPMRTIASEPRAARRNTAGSSPGLGSTSFSRREEEIARSRPAVCQACLADDS